MATVIVLTWELRIPGCRSLKEKRSTVRPLVERLRHRLHLSVAETDFQDVHDRAEITVALVSSDARTAQALADSADRIVQEAAGALVIRSRRESV